MVTPLPAATVILLRAPLEVLVVQRNPNLRFMGGFWAFPGGKVEETDADPEAAARRELTEEAGIVLPDSVELVPFARWITPVALPKRFDTWFFLAEHDAVPTPDGSEIVDARWINPGAREGLDMAFPTTRNLERIAGYSSVSDLIAAARATPVEPVLPEVVSNDGSPAVQIPGEAGVSPVPLGEAGPRPA